MSEDRSLRDVTSSVLRADPENIATARDTLIAFRNTVYSEPYKYALGNFAGILHDEFARLGALTMGDKRIQPFMDVFTKLQDRLQNGVIPRHDNAYHNDPHSMTVTAIRVMLEGISHRAVSRRREGFLYKLVRGAIIALCHDLGHNGLPNRVPGDRELASYLLLHPILVEAGVPAHERTFIKRAILLTDPGIPGEILKYGAAYHGFDPNILHLPREKIEELINASPAETQPMLGDLLYAVEHDRVFASEALLTKAADMTPSFGLNGNFCKEDSLNVQREIRAANPRHTVSTDDESVMKRQLFVALNFVGARREPEGTISATFMHRAADRLSIHVLEQLEMESRSRLPNSIIQAVEDGLKNHIVAAPTAKRPVRRPKLPATEPRA